MEALDQNLEDKNAHIIALDSGISLREVTYKDTHRHINPCIDLIILFFAGYKGAVDALERIRIYLGIFQICCANLCVRICLS